MTTRPPVLGTHIHTSHSLGDQSCGDAHGRLLAINDAMAVLGGKWKISLIGTLSFKGKRRFSDLRRDLDGIGPKMLAKELRDLEANQVITRTVKNTKPVTVEYEMTTYGHTLHKVICEIVSWGVSHRAHIMKGEPVGETRSMVSLAV